MSIYMTHNDAFDWSAQGRGGGGRGGFICSAVRLPSTRHSIWISYFIFHAAWNVSIFINTLILTSVAFTAHTHRIVKCVYDNQHYSAFHWQTFTESWFSECHYVMQVCRQAMFAGRRFLRWSISVCEQRHSECSPQRQWTRLWASHGSSITSLAVRPACYLVGLM